jgi:hypothetical protein
MDSESLSVTQSEDWYNPFPRPHAAMASPGGSRMQLQDFAQVVRSKNAGPRRFTLDVIFRSDADYAVKVINYPLGRAIKIVIQRPIMAGDPGDRDVYGAQQHTPLLGLEI